MSVKRYSVYGFADIQLSKDGNFVTYASYQKLEAQLAAVPVIRVTSVEQDKQLSKLEAQLAKAARYGYECGYEAGHNDTVESVFSLDAEVMSEEWWMLAEDELQQALENDDGIDDQSLKVNWVEHAKGLQAKLEEVRNLTGFYVPLSPPIEKAVWKSDIEAAIREVKT